VNKDTLDNIVFVLTMRCDQASRLISHSQERQLNKPERWALSLHLLICRVCRKYRKQLTFMRSLLSKLKEPELYFEYGSSYIDRKRSEDLRQRISKKIHERLDSK